MIRRIATKGVLSLSFLMLASAADAGDVSVASEQKISATAGGFQGPLVDFNFFGNSVAPIGDLDADGVIDIVVGAQHDLDAGTNSGAVYILFMNPNGTVKAEQKISGLAGGLTSTLLPADHFGVCVTGIGDHNGDGTLDLAVGAFHDKGGGLRRGALYILFLNPDGTVKAEQKINSQVGGLQYSLKDHDHFGAAVTSLGDVDGDGVTDLAVGARGNHVDDTSPGRVWILYMNVDGTVKAEHPIGLGEAGFTGVIEDGDGFAHALSTLDDLDGDGVRELLVGAPGDDDGGPARGAAWILFLDEDEKVKSHRKISSATFAMFGKLDDKDQFGYGVAALSDVDANGVADVAVSALQDDDGGKDRGAVYIFELNPSFGVKHVVKISSTTGGLVGPLANEDFMGHSLSAIGDLNGDGVTDIATGATGDDDLGFLPKGRSGALWILFLDAEPTEAWTNLHNGLAGGAGTPQLLGQGGLASGDVATLSVSGGPADAPAVLFLGTSSSHLELFGGTLVPQPQVTKFFWLDSSGGTAFGAPMPAGLPAGVSVYAQAWIQDLGAPAGASASNAVVGVLP